METKPYDKVVLNEEAKIEQLKNYNVNFDNTDMDFARQFLKVESFSFVLEYAKYAKKEMSFDELVDIFYKDRELRNAMFSIIDVIETHLKTISAELLTKKDPFFYKNNPESYFEEHCINKVKEIIEKSIKKNIINSTEEHIVYYQKYKEFPYLPFWSMIKYLSLGEVYSLYTSLNPFLQASICRNYKMNPATFGIWLRDLSLVRNLCAHNQRLWKRKFDFCNEKQDIKQLIDKLIQFLNNEPYKKPNENFLKNLQVRLDSLLG
ncbi:MAG: Abi family protein [Elusimicrobia bacterium]|nr:Abi family protein [Elusimicrobiota bacterium]